MCGGGGERQFTCLALPTVHCPGGKVEGDGERGLPVHGELNSAPRGKKRHKKRAGFSWLQALPITMRQEGTSTTDNSNVIIAF